jgi:hypothetical protein
MTLHGGFVNAFDVADQLTKCRKCGQGVVLKGLLAGYFRDVVEPGYAPSITHPECGGDLGRATIDPETVPPGMESDFDATGRRR